MVYAHNQQSLGSLNERIVFVIGFDAFRVNRFWALHGRKHLVKQAPTGQQIGHRARAKGLSMPIIIWKHMLKNALNPVITALSGWFASMLAGAVFVEYIFGWNGIGKEIVNALNVLDIPVLMGSVLTVSFLFIVINQVVDLLYAYLDPKVQLN